MRRIWVLLILAAVLICGGAIAADFFDDTKNVQKHIAEDPEGFKEWKYRLFGTPKNMDLLEELGAIIAAENFCGFDYDEAAVNGLIKRTSETDYTFTKSAIELDFLISKNRQANLFADDKASHCSLIAKLATAHGFVD